MKHGQTNTQLYIVWEGIKDRCYNTKDRAYKDYGGRGITVCDEWRNNFVAFREWAYANGYVEERLPSGRNRLSIDRKDNNAGYSPNNCRWVDAKTQSNNKRNNRNLTINGETRTIAEWTALCGFKPSTLKTRLYRGWSIEDLLIPVGERRNNNGNILCV